jgi:hypothetical protein
MTTLAVEVLTNVHAYVRAVISSYPEKCIQDPFAIVFWAGENGRTLDPIHTQTGAALGRESTAVLRPFDTLSGNPFLDYILN